MLIRFVYLLMIRLFGVVSAPRDQQQPRPRLRAGGRPAGQVPVSGIAFEKLSFSYPGSGRNVLRELDLEFPAGTSTAVVGLNGAGKTTLVKLLCGLYQPTSGRISVDGAALEEFDARSWQRCHGKARRERISGLRPLTASRSGR
jgi:ABC-type bacteriocin/lantibiotic exporter with double-glycine peptidase domain